MIAMNRQGGYSLVELMVAGTLGLLLMTGVINIYISGLHTSKLQTSLAEMQDRARFMSQFFVEDMLKAGWSDPMDDSQAAINGGLVLGAGATEDNVAECDAGSASDCDAIQIRYFGVTDCLGVEVDGGAVALVTNTYTVQDGEFRCTGVDGDATTLFGNVESFQLLYGIDDRDAGGTAGTTPDGLIDRYLAAADIPAGSNVLAVRYAILLRSNSENTLDVDTTRQYTLLNEDELEFTDRRLRVLFSGTVPVSNF